MRRYIVYTAPCLHCRGAIRRAIRTKLGAHRAEASPKLPCEFGGPVPRLGYFISLNHQTTNLPLLGIVGSHFADTVSPQLLSRDIATSPLVPAPEAGDCAQACAPPPSAVQAHQHQCDIDLSAPVTLLTRPVSLRLCLFCCRFPHDKNSVLFDIRFLF